MEPTESWLKLAKGSKDKHHSKFWSHLNFYILDFLIDFMRDIWVGYETYQHITLHFKSL